MILVSALAASDFSLKVRLQPFDRIFGFSARMQIVRLAGDESELLDIFTIHEPQFITAGAPDTATVRTRRCTRRPKIVPMFSCISWSASVSSGSRQAKEKRATKYVSVALYLRSHPLLTRRRSQIRVLSSPPRSQWFRKVGVTELIGRTRGCTRGRITAPFPCSRSASFLREHSCASSGRRSASWLLERGSSAPSSPGPDVR